MRFKHLVYILIIAIVSFNCSNESEEELNNIALEAIAEENEDEENAVVTYDGEIRDIMANNCNLCHTQPLAFGAPFPLLTFNEVSDRADRIIARMNNVNNPMPPSGQLPLEIRVVVQQWITDGLLENE